MLTAQKTPFPLATSELIVRTLSKNLPAHKPAKRTVANPQLSGADLHLRFAAHTPNGIILLPTPTDKDEDNIPEEVADAWRELSGPIWEALFTRFEAEQYEENPSTLLARSISDFYQPEFPELQPIIKKHSPHQHAIVGDIVLQMSLSIASQYGTLPPSSSRSKGIRHDGPEYGLHEVVKALQQELEAGSAKNSNVFFKLYSVKLSQTFTQEHQTEFVLLPA